MTKAEEKARKAIKAINEVKAIEARQAEVKNFFNIAEEAEGKDSELLQGIKKSETYFEACKSFRIASTSALQALEDKVFKSQQELADFLGFDKNKMSRIVKSGKVFRLHSSEQLAGKGLDELAIKTLTHDDPKLITELINGEKSIEEAKEQKEAKAKNPSRKFDNAVEKLIELLADENLSKAERFNGFKQIEAQAGLILKDEMKAHMAQKIEAYQQMMAGKKSKVNA